MGIANQSGHVYYYSLAELQQRNSYPKVDVLEHSAMDPRYEIPSGESSVGATATGMMACAPLMLYDLRLLRMRMLGMFNSDIYFHSYRLATTFRLST